MILTVQVVYKDKQQSEETQTLRCQGDQKRATMQHLVWETVPVIGKERCRQRDS